MQLGMVVEARALRDPAFRERWGEVVLAKMDRRILASQRRRQTSQHSV